MARNVSVGFTVRPQRVQQCAHLALNVINKSLSTGKKGRNQFPLSPALKKALPTPPVSSTLLLIPVLRETRKVCPCLMRPEISLWFYFYNELCQQHLSVVTFSFAMIIGTRNPGLQVTWDALMQCPTPIVGVSVVGIWNGAPLLLGCCWYLKWWVFLVL